MIKQFLTILMILVGLLLSRTAEASHFRYGNITWTVPDPINNPYKVKFVVTHAWRTSLIGNVVLFYGNSFDSGMLAATTIGTGTDITGQTFTVRESVVEYQYAGPGTYVAYFFDCCRVLGLQNGSNDGY